MGQIPWATTPRLPPILTPSGQHALDYSSHRLSRPLHDFWRGPPQRQYSGIGKGGRPHHQPPPRPTLPRVTRREHERRTPAHPSSNHEWLHLLQALALGHVLLDTMPARGFTQTPFQCNHQHSSSGPCGRKGSDGGRRCWQLTGARCSCSTAVPPQSPQRMQT